MILISMSRKNTELTMSKSEKEVERDPGTVYTGSDDVFLLMKNDVVRIQVRSLVRN